MNTPQSRPLEDTSPCIGCGMCCNGTLYARAKVAPGEAPRLLELGLELTEQGDQTYFRLPCVAESCGQCTIYESRFEICRTFRCALLRSYGAGEASLDEAQERVSTAKRLLADVVADRPDAARYEQRQVIRGELAQAATALDPADRRRAARQLLKIIALDTYLERWFRNKKSEPPEQPDLA